MDAEKYDKKENIQQPITLNCNSVGIDVDYYQEVIDDPQVSEARKRQLIEIIGAIVLNFIDMGFGVHPVQLARNDKDDGPIELPDN